MARYATFALPETKCFAAEVPEGLAVRVGDLCVVKRGTWLELCRVRLLMDQAPPCAAGLAPLPAVIVRLAGEDDLARAMTSRELETRVMAQFDEETAGAPQGVHAVAARFNLDRTRLILFYHGDQRFDARAIGGRLARRFKTAVEARQIGIRDETAVLGGVGSCGRPVCCATWLREFRPLNVRMAKAQGISLNPTSINGYCGRLKCCLRYELEKPEAPGGSEREENET